MNMFRDFYSPSTLFQMPLGVGFLYTTHLSLSSGRTSFVVKRDNTEGSEGGSLLRQMEMEFLSIFTENS